jgi:N-acylneuraminate cytidylyltransferase
MVSTDDEQIAEVAKKYGATIPIFRSKKNAGDYATTPDVIEEVLSNYEKQGKKYTIFCCIYPTAPFISRELLNKGYQLLVSRKYDSVFPVVQFNYPIQRALRINNGYTTLIWPENYEKRSQDLEPAYHDSGQFYWMWAEKFQEKKALFTEHSGSIILSGKQVQDIDDPEDWEIAEMKYQLLNREA